jgi:hypothetical protein
MAWVAPVLEFTKVFVDLAKAALWPAVAAAFIWLFREQLRLLVPRLKSLGPTGASFVEAPNNQAEVERSITEPGSKTSLPPPTPAVRMVEDRLRANVPALGADSVTDNLYRLTAAAQLNAHYCRVYIAIFGSQITILKQTNELGPMEPGVARQIFSNAMKDFSAFYGAYTFEEWVSFLTNTELLTVESGRYVITDVGSGFLIFLPESKLTEHKAG